MVSFKNSIRRDPDIQLQKLATKVFKDKVSITRIITLLKKNKYINSPLITNNFRTDTQLHISIMFSKGFLNSHEFPKKSSILQS